MNTLDFVQVEDDARFTAYCAGLATVLKHRLEKGEALNERETKWLSQFGPPELATCQRLIDGYAILKVTERLAQHTPPM